jgi:hypothetical protein
LGCAFSDPSRLHNGDVCGKRVLVGLAEATAVENILMQATALDRLGSLRETYLLVRQSFRVTVYNP